MKVVDHAVDVYGRECYRSIAEHEKTPFHRVALLEELAKEPDIRQKTRLRRNNQLHGRLDVAKTGEQKTMQKFCDEKFVPDVLSNTRNLQFTVSSSSKNLQKYYVCEDSHLRKNNKLLTYGFFSTL